MYQMKLKGFLFLCSAIAAVLVTSSVSFGLVSINWGTDTFRVYERDGTTLINGDTNRTVAGFVQLIYLGANGQYDGFDQFAANGEGLVNDDDAVATLWIGGGIKGGPDGRFTSPTAFASSLPKGSRFVIRFFNTPSPNFTTGAVPTSAETSPYDGGTPHYGYTDVFEQTTDADGANLSFTFTDNYDAIYPVPEPGTMGLVLVGVGMLAARFRRRQS